ncbi:uncharacterized protein G2W53_009876 [Senna tora]|uniref:Uncharacterized protein n=1 Tax=Senna tora TaxID=362788 RepID=A0A834WZP6_9FABA|nr:uncharacterized protein G2W53_009876 [Senna tora]
MFQLELTWHGRSVDHVLTYSGREIAIISQKPSRITRRKTCCSGFDAGIGVVKAWEERGSCLNIFQMTNRGRISETITKYEAKELLRINHHELRGKRFVAQVIETLRFALYLLTGVDLILELESSWHGSIMDYVLTYSGLEIAVGSQKSSQITRQKTCRANEKSRLDLRNLHELRGKRLVAQVSETRRFALYLRISVDLMLELEPSRHGRSVDHVSTYSE